MNRIKTIRNSRNLTQQDVADALGIAVVTYNRLENGHTKLSTKRIDELSKILNVDPVEFLASRPTARTIPVVGQVCAGHWASSFVWLDPDDNYSIAIPNNPQFQNIQLNGVETKGPSMNLRYPDGTILIFNSIIETKEPLRDGQRYIVERERLDGKIEATVKKLIMDNQNQFWLMPESDDPRHQTPIILKSENGDTIRIIGRVVYSVQPEG